MKSNNHVKKTSLIDIMSDYFDKMIDSVHGMKSLIVDSETLSMISLVYSQSQILKRDIYLIEQIQALQSNDMPHLKGVVFVRPTLANFQKIEAELQKPRFDQYYLFFTNSISNSQIERFAESDDKDVLKGVQEVFGDYYAVNDDLFTFNLDMTLGLNKVQQM